ncbi:MAG: ribosome maturation factor RimP [Actinomycetota bacterium]
MSEESAIERRLHSLIDPIVADLALDLYDLDYAGGVLKVTVDTPPGSPGGIDVDTLAQCTRLISRELDHSDPIPGHYTLEVSSPGLERTLRTPRHFQREVGKEVSIRLRNVENGDRRITGLLVAADDQAATVRAMGPQAESTDHRVVYDQIDRAKTVFVWEAAPKPGKSGGKKPRATADSGARKSAMKNSPTSKNIRNNDQEPSPS